MAEIHWKVANALASVVLASRSYTVLDRLANAISPDAVDKAVYELGRNLEVIIRNPKDDQAIRPLDDLIEIKGKWNHTSKTFRLKGKLPEPRDYEYFLKEAEDIRVARHTAAYAAGLVSSSISSTIVSSKEIGK